MKDELQIEIDTSWHVFNDMAQNLLTHPAKHNRDAVVSKIVRERVNTYPTTIHTMKDE